MKKTNSKQNNPALALTWLVSNYSTKGRYKIQKSIFGMEAAILFVSLWSTVLTKEEASACIFKTSCSHAQRNYGRN